MSKEFHAWVAWMRKKQQAITSCDHAWLADNTDYAHCPGCGERLRQKPEAEPKGGAE